MRTRLRRRGLRVPLPAAPRLLASLPIGVFSVGVWSLRLLPAFLRRSAALLVVFGLVRSRSGPEGSVKNHVQSGLWCSK